MKKCEADAVTKDKCRLLDLETLSICKNRERCMYQVDEHTIALPEKTEGWYVFEFECSCKGGRTFTQKSDSAPSQILSMCGECGKEISYTVIQEHGKE